MCVSDIHNEERFKTKKHENAQNDQGVDDR
jgi:hypothetical protein